MPTTYTGTAAVLNGKVIASFEPGDQIEITDETPAAAKVMISGDTLQYTNGSITIDNLGPGRYVVRALGTTGTDIRLQQDAHNDFNGDGFSDVLWRNDNGTLTDWVNNGSGFTPNSAADGTFNVPTSWHMVGTGDFNGDGHVDILWRNDNGTLTDWFGTTSGGFTTANNFTASVPTNWQVVGIGDFNRDGHSDILWRDSNTGTITDWFATASGGFTTANNFTASVPTNWQVVGTGDFNGDGHDDILWRDNNSGTITDWLGNDSGGFTPNTDPTASANVPLAWQVAGTGDFNGDGLTDILWRNTTTGTITDWLGNNNGGFAANTDATASATVPLSWHVAGIGDFNNDAVDDILWRNDNGTTTDWFGTPAGGFTTDHNWTGVPPTSWHVQDPLL